MTKPLPSLFVSHGAPDIVLHHSAAREFLSNFGGRLVHNGSKPKAVLIATAHFETAAPQLTADDRPGMIYDFAGFDERLYDVRYPAPGAPELARQAADLLDRAGMQDKTVVDRGYDHGTWVPLMLLFPQADIPIVPLSVQPQAGTTPHFKLGAALAPLRDEGVLIVRSTTHNLREFFHGGYRSDSLPPDCVRAFGAWVQKKVEAGAVDDIANYRLIAPCALDNHPSEEHFVPLPWPRVPPAPARRASGPQ
jgi:4,5-DOPA dioxygenase extradiol